jgi:RNA 3'-terminal phosphate cyclase
VTGRSKPGLAAQHLTGLQLLASTSGGTLEGGEKGSTTVVLSPGDHPIPGTHVGDIGVWLRTHQYLLAGRLVPQLFLRLTETPPHV